MARPHPLREMMKIPLPELSEQKKVSFVPSKRLVTQTYDLINKSIFDNKMWRPEIILKRTRGYWGKCDGIHVPYKTGSYCYIDLSERFICLQWFVTVLAHEMVHQYQWDVEGLKRDKEGRKSLMSHGPSFFEHRERLEYYSVPLKTAHSIGRWYETQDFFAS